MPKHKYVFGAAKIFEYGRLKKKQYGITLILMSVFIGFLLVYYLAFLRTLDTPITNAINAFALHVGSQIKMGTPLGALYSAFFGGLFFIVIYMEAVFLALLRGGHSPVLLMFLYVFGIFISYNLDYFIGRRLANVSKSLISPKKFYKVKGFLNRHGPWAIFLFNVLPLPSQILSAILGVFKYNRVRFNVFFMSGQLLKYALIIVAYLFIF